MKKRAEDIYHKQVGKILMAVNKNAATKELLGLLKLADICDTMGETKDAEHIDKVAIQLEEILKQAQWWSSLMAGGGDVLKRLWDMKKENKPLFSKAAVIDLLTNFLATTGVALITNELVDVIEAKIPIISWFADKDKINFVVKGVLAYAIKNTDFVSGIVDGLENEIGNMLGIDMSQQLKHPDAEQKNQSPAPVAETKPATNPAAFQYAQPVPGQKPAKPEVLDPYAQKAAGKN